MLRKEIGESTGFEVRLAWPGSCAIPEANVEFIASIQLADDAGRGSPICAVLDPEALPEILTIRPRRPGDRYGGKGHRKLKKVLLNARIPAAARDSLPLVADGDAVIWAPGLPPAKTYRARSSCSRCVRLEVRPLQDDGKKQASRFRPLRLSENSALLIEATGRSPADD